MRRTAADRKAEAARAREMTEQALARKIVPLRFCEYDRKRRILRLASEFFGMPREFYVVSEHTGKEVRFVAVGPEDLLFSPDQWDGEQQVYRPVGDVPTIDHMVIYHQY